MLMNLKMPLSWTELNQKDRKSAIADDVMNLAAQQAYYFFFALFPALLTRRRTGRRWEKKSPGRRRRSACLPRDYERRRVNGQMTVQPFPDDINCDVDRKTPKAEHAVRPGEIPIGTAARRPAAIKIGREIKEKVGKNEAA